MRDMMRRFLTFGILLSVLLFGQSDYSKKRLFYDNFNDNTQGWYTGRKSGVTDVKISDGVYRIQNLLENKSRAYWNNKIKIDETRDFEIEARLRFVEGNRKNTLNIFWGRNKAAHRFRFGFSANGSYRIDKWDGSWYNFKDYTKHSSISASGFNTLKIQRKGNMYHFYLNGYEVHSMPFVRFYGDRVGFDCISQTTMEVDYVEVSYLEKKVNYTSSSASQKTPILVENFYSNTNGWYTGSKPGTDKAEISNGYYTLTNLLEKKNKIFWLEKKIDTQRDFEIETRFKHIYGPDNNSNNLFWGRNTSNQRFRFGISDNGQYRIDSWNGSEWTNQKKWTVSSLISKTDYNTLKIVKKGSNYSYYINGTFVHSGYFQPFFGPYLGIEVMHKTQIKVDYIYAYYIDTQPQPIVSSVNYGPQIQIYEPSLDRGFRKVQEKILHISGKAVDADGVFEVKVNNMDAYLQSNGMFSIDIPLAPGDNIVSVVAKDTRYKSNTRTFTVNRENMSKPTLIASGQGSGLGPQIEEKRLALVIGNSNYTGAGKLANPVNDARSMKFALDQLNFKVLKYENLSQADMKMAIDDFGSQLKNYDIGLFFFAGHGLQVKGNNYLVPVDAVLKTENHAEYDCVRADRVLASMEEAGSKTNIVILDACRNNPFERSWNRSSGGNGLAFMNAPSGSLIAYATSPGSTASDGRGKNGLYTSALLEHINTNNVSILEMFQKVRSTVIKQSNGKQTPWESTSLTGSFYFSK
jgi:hypothetical protein